MISGDGNHKTILPLLVYRFAKPQITHFYNDLGHVAMYF